MSIIFGSSIRIFVSISIDFLFFISSNSFSLSKNFFSNSKNKSDSSSSSFSFSLFIFDCKVLNFLSSDNSKLFSSSNIDAMKDSIFLILAFLTAFSNDVIFSLILFKIKSCSVTL